MIIASGVQYRRLAVPGVTPLEGAGVFYGAAMTEAAACKDQDVFVIGGGNSAGQGAIFLADYARSVTILIRGKDLSASMSQYLIERIDAVAEYHGAALHRGGPGRRRNRAGNGHAPQQEVGRGGNPPRAWPVRLHRRRARTDWLGDAVMRDERGFIVTGRDLQQMDPGRVAWPLERDPFLTETSVPGVFAAGDVRCGSVKRVAAAVGEGSVTVSFVHEHLGSL